MDRATRILSALILLLLFGCTAGTVPRARELLEAPRITVEQLRRLLDHGEVTILDVRALDVYNHSRYKIAGAVYADPGNIESWVPHYAKDRPLVLY